MTPDRKVHGANMGPIWVLSSSGGPQVGPKNLAIWVTSYYNKFYSDVFYLTCLYIPAICCQVVIYVTIMGIIPGNFKELKSGYNHNA